MARATRGGKSGDDEESATGPTTPAIDLAPLFAAVPEQNVLILVDASLTTIPAAVKRAAPRETRIIAGEPPRGRALLTWLKATARELGGVIDDRAAQFLVETLYPRTWANPPSNLRFDRPPDTELLRNELTKLVTAADPEPVTRHLIEQMTAGAADDRVFRFIEAASEGRLGPALVELEQLTLAGEEPAKIAAQLAQQIELIAVAAVGGGDPAAIGRDLGLANPNRMAGVAASRAARDRRRAVRLLADAVEADRSLKRGRLRQPEDQLYALLTLAAEGGTRPGNDR